MITGIDEVCEALVSAADRISAAAERGVKDACAAVCGDAKSMCPVRTGNLRESIATQSSGTDGTVYAAADYGGYVELGTYKMPAQPFLAPALTAATPIIAEMVLSEVRE